MRSLVSRKFATEIFNWQWHYYFLKPEGIKFLREYLGLPDTIIPNTHKLEVGKTEEINDEQKVEEEGKENRRGGRDNRERGNRDNNRGNRTTTGRGGRGARVEN